MGGFHVPALFAQEQSDLQRIHQQIQQTQEKITNSLKQETRLEASLEKAEVALSNIQREKNSIDQQIQAQQKELDQLHAEETALLEAKAEQEKNINLQINASYRLGHEKNVKVILNQQDTKTLSRSLVYSDYLTKARLDALKAFEETLQKIAANKLAIENKNAELAASKLALAEKEEKLKASFAERNATLKALQASIKTDESKISRLKGDQAKLKELLAQIRAQQIAAEKNRIANEKRAQALRDQQQKEDRQQPATATKPAVISPLILPDNHIPFAKTKGQLRWPAKGRLDNRYGKSRQPGDFQWEGIAFIAEAGTNVQAIHSGKIVFADWFRGKGLLVIIDHGNGFMSLYAHNQTLLKKTGELVSTGENIATVGNSGGLGTPELYFEIRHQGKPINPNFWLTHNG
jgi:murein hydrolase activator